jgi:hypothetical protein
VARFEAAVAPVLVLGDREFVLAASKQAPTSLGQWNVQTGELTAIAELPDGERALAFANDGEFVATTRGLIRVHSDRITRLYELPELSEKSSVPTRAKFSPDGVVCVFVQHGVESRLGGQVICVDQSGASSKPFVPGTREHPMIVFDAAVDSTRNAAWALAGFYLPIEHTDPRFAAPLKMDVADRIK